MKNRSIEFLVGSFVLLGLAAVLYLAIQVGRARIASVKTAGLIGDRFIDLSPGGGFPMEPGYEIVDTESALDIESLISRFALGGIDDKAE
jgi:ABC-type transporter Mla subunit MlaD